MGAFFVESVSVCLGGISMNASQASLVGGLVILAMEFFLLISQSWILALVVMALGLVVVFSAAGLKIADSPRAATLRLLPRNPEVHKEIRHNRALTEFHVKNLPWIY
jgi:hypothetical protein